MKLILPNWAMFGWGGSAPFPWLIILSSKYKDNLPLIIHEQTHQEQQRRDGWFKWVYRYLFKPEWRQTYEVEAYRAQLKLQPSSASTFAYSLANKYKLDINYIHAYFLLTSDRDN